MAPGSKEEETLAILATHVGSLIRPPELLQFNVAKERGEAYDEAAYEQALATATEPNVRELLSRVALLLDGPGGP